MINKLTIKLDEYGRIIIKDEEILKKISGAIQNNENGIFDNEGCTGPNTGCSNTNC